MTATPSISQYRLAVLSADEFRARVTEALNIYVTAMHYPASAVAQRAPLWLAHIQRTGWRGIAAFDVHDRLIGFGYGGNGAPGQWWHEQVCRGIRTRSGSAAIDYWMLDYFEVTELHVLPHAQGCGIGEGLLRGLLAGVNAPIALLSTPEGPTRAWRLYRRVGFRDVLRDYLFMGDARPFAVLGRQLPLN